MSISSDGILFYGILWDDYRSDLEPPLPWCDPDDEDNDTDMEDWLWGLWDLPDTSDTSQPGWRDEYRAIKEKRRQAMTDRFGAVIKEGLYCSYDYPMPYIAIESSETRVVRGYSKQITSLDVKPEWDAALAKIAEMTGYPDKKPGWFLVSLYG